MKRLLREPSEQRMRRITSTASQRQKGLTIVLEDVHDPHNAAAVLRSCEGFGVQDIHFVFVNQEEYDPRRIGKQSSSSAHKWLNYHMHHSIEDCYKSLREKDYELWATILSEDSESLYEVNLATTEEGEGIKNVALLFGNEHAGLTKSAIDGADHKLYLPMRGMTESLNISVTVAICLFEVTRQRIATGLEFTLDQAHRDELIEDFKGR